MCPAEQQPAAAEPAAAAVVAADNVAAAADAADETTDVAADPLANFAIDAARRQAVERGEEEGDIDEEFINRALAEAQRMRKEREKSEQKRAANFASIAKLGGDQGIDAIHAAMAEHAAEVLAPTESAAISSSSQEPAEAS